MMFTRRVTTAAILTAAVATTSVAAPGGTTLLVHGHIYTADPARPWAEAVLVEGERIAQVGSDRELLARRAKHARVLDLHGRTVIPGVIDAHLHLLFGAMEIDGLNLSTPDRSLTPEHPQEFVAAVRAWAESQRSRQLLIMRADFSSAQPSAPTHALLDQAVSDRPLVVHNSTEHSLWVNAKMLQLAGITDEPVADPEEERNIIRDASGHPSGVLLEAAQEIIERAVLRELTTDQKLALLAAGTRYLNRFGITSIVNATGNLAEIELYAALRARGELTVRTRTAFGAVAVPQRLTPQLLADLETARTRYHDDWVSANLVKFFADGSTGLVPPLVYRPADYRALVLELDRRGYQLMTHAQRGDSVHMILDAYENAVRTNGPRDRRLRIEHDFVVSDEDAARYPRLGVVAGIQPAFCCTELGTNYDPQDPTPADRWHTLLSAGTVLAFSSDWPCMWPPDPFVNMQQAVTRQVWHSPDTANIATEPLDGAHQGGAVPTPGVYYKPEERIGVTDAVDAYTRNAAFAAFADEHVGSLAPGKDADLAVLSQDLFAVPAEKIEQTHVVMTMVGGKVVYRAPEFEP
jgi:predicted amidohydrolase YtcJ